MVSAAFASLLLRGFPRRVFDQLEPQRGSGRPNHLYQLFSQPAGVRLYAGGADLVLGHQPHVLQGLALGEEGIIAYSLGNFIFDQTTEATRGGLILEAACDRQGVRQLRVTPLLITDEQPQVAGGEEARRIRRLLAAISQGLTE